MIVPIDLLPPILDDLLDIRPGQQAGAAVAWRLFCRERRTRSIVASVAENGPAAEAGLRRGDILAGVGGARDRKPRRILSQGLEPGPGRGRDSGRDRPRRPGDGLARAFGRPLVLPEAPRLQ